MPQATKKIFLVGKCPRATLVRGRKYPKGTLTRGRETPKGELGQKRMRASCPAPAQAGCSLTCPSGGSPQGNFGSGTGNAPEQLWFEDGKYPRATLVRGRSGTQLTMVNLKYRSVVVEELLEVNLMDWE